MVWQNESDFFLFWVFFILQKRILEATPKYELVQFLNMHWYKHRSEKRDYFHPRFSSEEQHLFTEIHRKKRWKSGKAQVALALEQKHGTWWKQKALLLGWEHESALSSKANPGCILMETGCACPDMLCVWVPLFITLNTSSGLRRLNGITATDARSYSQWFTIWLYFVSPGCTSLPTMLPFSKGPCYVFNSV